MRQGAARRVALMGVLFALALVLGLLENTLTPVLGLPPGVKPGLANIVVMFCLFCLSRRQALLLVVLKAGFSFLVRGAVAGALSLTGGLLSLLVMVALLALPAGKSSIWLVSIAGALAHNLGQMAVVALLFGQASWYYAPVLLLSGLAMGSLTAVLLRVLLPYLTRIQNKGD